MAIRDADAEHTGTIQVAGITHKARFDVDGFDRRWNFGPLTDHFQYAFLIRPDGLASYVDFSHADADGCAAGGGADDGAAAKAAAMTIEAEPLRADPPAVVALLA